MQRRLAAIVFADAVGYSRLIQQDEAGTRARFQAVSREMVAPLVSGYGGRLIKTMGDAFMVEFPSAVDSVAFAVELQKGMAEHESAAPADRRIELRIGINLGDVIVEGDELHGDGVNIAARLEKLARPGGICLSQKVHDEVDSKLELSFRDGGEHLLKNIRDPIRVFHVEPAAATTGKDTPARMYRAGPPHARPVIAVRPITAIGRNEDIDELAQGLREVVISGLAGFRSLAVSRDRSGEDADYVLEGAVRGSGNRIRANFTLHDNAKGTEVWAQRYDRTFEDVFELEDEIASSVVSVVHFRLKSLEMERLEVAENDSLDVEQLLSKAAGIFVRTPGENEAAGKILALALERDPSHSMAHAMEALRIWRVWEFSPLKISPEDGKRLLKHADRAVELDRKSYFALLIAAIACEELSGDYRISLDYVEQALQINPGYNPARGTAAIARSYLGDFRNGPAALRDVIAVNRDDPYRFRHLRELALILMMNDRFEEASDAVRRLERQAPDMHRNLPVAAAIYQLAGKPQQASRIVAELLRQFPALTIADMRPVHFISRDHADRFNSALSGAGLPIG